MHTTQGVNRASSTFIGQPIHEQGTADADDVVAIPPLVACRCRSNSKPRLAGNCFQVSVSQPHQRFLAGVGAGTGAMEGFVGIGLSVVLLAVKLVWAPLQASRPDSVPEGAW